MKGTFPESTVQEVWLEDLMQQYGSAVLRLCYGYLKDASLAEDAAQETFLKAWRKRADFPNIQSVRAWLMRIAINVCKDTLRSAWFRHVDRKTDIDDALLVAHYTLIPQQQNLIDMVMSLKPKERMVLLLFYYQDASAEEIATILGISCSTIYYRLKQAQKKLRLKLEKEDQDG